MESIDMRQIDMRKFERKNIDDGSAWTGAELAAGDEWIWKLDESEIGEIREALANAKLLDKAWQETTAADFPLVRVAEGLKEIAYRLEYGRGITLIQGIPITCYELEDLKRLYLGIFSHMGTPVIQNGGAGMMREVRDTGGPRVESPSRLSWHNDRADVVCLLCLRKAAEGGISRVVSATAIYNAFLERHPKLLEALFGDFYRSSIGDEVGTDAPYYMLPVFTMQGNAFTSDLSRVYINQAQSFPEIPRLTEEQTEALDMIEELSEELCYEHMIEPGDIQILNNHVTYHARTEYTDDAASGRDRFLLRLWLMTAESRRLPKDQAALWSSAELTNSKLSEISPTPR
tara:strand:- start:1151 stop:2185 length:1035 start_codon:yes stop_codon:yes gene_type:complete